MTHRNLKLWLDAPFETPPDNDKLKQTIIPFPDLDSIIKPNEENTKENLRPGFKIPISCPKRL
jgi:hypothetical protein